MNPRIFFLVALFACRLVLADETAGWPHGAVASVHPLATQAGVAAMKRGGNAVDAAIATAITLGVVDGQNSGLGAGGFILIHPAKGEIVAIDARETAPALATVDMFLRGGKVDEELSKTGPLSVATPGILAGYAAALEGYGKLPLKDILLPAAELAEKGFVLDAESVRRLEMVREQLRQFPGSKSIFFHEDGSFVREGETLRQPDLAHTLRMVAEQGISWFYRGEFAERVDAWMRENGGLLRKEDLAAYAVQRREPIHTKYRGYDLYGFPPPSSGGVHVAEILGILAHFDLASAPVPEREHLIAEAMKLAFADRAYWLGDPDFVRVPRGLIDPEYTKSLAAKIDPARATKVPSHGEPPRAADDIFKHTTHLSTADAEGNWVALTQTINNTFGSKVIVPGTGVVLNDEMDDFSAAPGVPNAFGLLGAEANAVGPGKRPLSSMSPTIVLKDGRPILSIGAAGGPTIISQTVQNLVNVLDLKMGIEAAVAAPRLHHQWSPDSLRVEPGMGEDVIADLRARGHAVQVAGVHGIGASQGVQWNERAGTFTAAHDPRVPGLADGW